MENKSDNKVNNAEVASKKKDAKGTVVVVDNGALSVVSIIKTIDLTDSTSIVSYGAAAQRKSSDFAESILQNTSAKNLGETGDVLQNLVLSIKSFDAESSLKQSGFFGKLFGIANKKIEKIKLSFSTAAGVVDKIVEDLEKHRRILMQDTSILDKLYEKNLAYIDELAVYIEAGEEKIVQTRENELQELKTTAETDNDQLDVQAYKDMLDSLNRFEKKVHDLKLTRTVTLQMLPQIRLQQANNNILVDKIQSSIVNAIPLWKSQMVIALGLSDAKNALKAQRAVTDTTNELLAKNSEMLKTSTIETAREAERSIIDIEVIKKANADIVYTITEVGKIQEEGRQKRLKADEELTRLGQELKDNIMKALN